MTASAPGSWPEERRGNDNGFLFKGKNGGPRCRPGLSVRNRGPLPPLGDGLRVDPMASGEGPQALLTMLYRSTDRRCRAGAPVKNLSHSASFWRSEKYAPSISGTKHLGLLASHAVAEPDGEVRSLATISSREELIRKLIKKLGSPE